MTLVSCVLISAMKGLNYRSQDWIPDYWMLLDVTGGGGGSFSVQRICDSKDKKLMTTVQVR